MRRNSNIRENWDGIQYQAFEDLYVRGEGNNLNFSDYDFIEQSFPLTFFTPVKDEKFVGIPDSSPVHNYDQTPDE